MQNNILLLPILIPFAAGLLSLGFPKKLRAAKEVFVLLASAITFLIGAFLFKKSFVYSLPWVDFNIDLSFKLYSFNSFILLAIGFFGFLITLYSLVFMRQKNALNQFYLYLLSALAFSNGAVLSDNLMLLFFFWEGLLLLVFGLIAIGGENSFRTATKAFIIDGVAGLCMLVGIGLVWYLAGTLTISKINLSLNPLGGLAFVFLMIGAIAKAGSMPFHSWIPDAAKDSPLPFMAFFPAALEKLLGIYFLTRITLDMFKLSPDSWASTALMVIGSITILLAVMMALVQKDFKKLLSYHAISQVGYMILGVGTCLPIGIVGGLFHMINNSLYKSCLFLTGGAVEKQAGTTDLGKLGGLRSSMPVTFGCFIIAAAAISGVPPFNGFFSKELVFDAALKRGWIFYLAALLGAFFTAASFLKLGHAVFFGKKNDQAHSVKESTLPMLIPMIVIAAICVLFGIFNGFAITNFIQPVLGDSGLTHEFNVFSHGYGLIVISMLVLFGALINHLIGAKIKGSGVKALDHIRYAPILSGIYDRAEKRFFDPYELGLKIINIFSGIAWVIDRSIDWVYDKLVTGLTALLSRGIMRLHSGSYAVYIGWSLIATVIVVLYLI